MARPATQPAASRILVIEDNPGHCELLQEALDRNGVTCVTRIEHHADSAFAWLERQSASSHPSFPNLVLLDLKLNDGSGLGFLLRVRNDRRVAHLPVVVLTTSDDPHDVAASYAAGANGYVVKPATFEDLTTLAGDLCRYWLNWNRCACPVVPSKEPFT